MTSDPGPVAAHPVPAPGDPGTPGPTAPTFSAAIPPRCPTRTRLYRDGKVAAEGFPAEAISDLLSADQDSVVWLDLLDPDNADLSIVTREFGLHPLAVEDAIVDGQRPKLDRYRTHLFANLYAVAARPGEADLAVAELSAFITPRALVTVRKGAFDVDGLIRHWDLNADLAGGGVEFLTYGFLDVIVDGHYEAAQVISAEVDLLENDLTGSAPRREVRRRGFELRRRAQSLRRVVAPMNDVISRLTRGNAPHFSGDQLAPYFQDVSDHALQAVENAESARERIGNVLDTSLNEQSYELNEITKKLAAWAAIIAVPTAVTGYYGQNVPYPGFGRLSGFVSSIIVMIVLAVALYAFLRRRGWL